MEYIYYYVNSNASLRERYAGLDDREIALKYTDLLKLNIDMFLPPEEIRQRIDLAPEGFRFVRQLKLDNGEKTFLRLYHDQLQFPAEAEISAAMKRLIMDVPRVACLTGHGERDMDNVGDRDYYSFAKDIYFRYALVNQGFDVESYRLSADEEIPDRIDILVIADMRESLTGEELEKIDRYIQRGGNLIIAGEPGRQEIMNPLVEKLGVRFEPGTLVQPTKDYRADLVQGEVTKKAAEMSHEYAKLLKKKFKVVMPGAVGLSYRTDTDFLIQPILTTCDSGSWNELETTDWINGKVQLNPLIGEIEQANPIALALSRTVGNKEQRIIVLGDADCISNAELMMTRKGIKASNYSLITESFRWLTNGEFPIDTWRPDPLDTSVSLELSSMKWVKAGILGIFPLLLIACGVLVWYRRRGR